jgi:D-alanyl-D-alanine-carboxypeptidase/D-alanyl-D-alanine-endopeptidase
MGNVIGLLVLAGALASAGGVAVLVTALRGPERARWLKALLALPSVLVGTYVLVQAGLQPVWLAPSPPPPAAADRLGAMIEEEVAPLIGPRFVGVVVGILEGSKRHVSGYGETVLGSGRAPDGDTVFPIGSVTKVFTAVLLSEMVGRGELRLEDPLALHLPEAVALPRLAGREITLLDLATHTSGLPRNPGYLRPSLRDALTFRALKNPYSGHSRKELFARLGELELAAPPGEAYAYSNLGVGLLGHALAQRAGASYEELVRSRIFEPLGMSSTGFLSDQALASRLAPGYHGYFRAGPLGVAFAAPAWESRVLQASGAVASTTHDLLQFLEANLEPPPGKLGAALVAAQTPRYPRGEAPGEQVALGWLVSPREGASAALWHNGATGGYTSYVALVPQSRFALVVLGNTSSPVEEVGEQLLRKLCPRPIKPGEKED